MAPKKGTPRTEPKKTAPPAEPPKVAPVLEPITARISEEAARRLRVAAALENLSTGQLLDRLILESLADLPTMVGQAWDYNRRRPVGQ